MDSYEIIHCEENTIFKDTIDYPKYIMKEATPFNINFSHIGNLDLSVYGKEGPVPHFHLSSKSNDFQCCVCIYKPYYFDHGRYRSKLNSVQKRMLDSFLREQYENKIEGYKGTRWGFISYLWKKYNGIRYNIEYTDIQPDYTQMENYTKE